MKKKPTQVPPRLPPLETAYEVEEQTGISRFRLYELCREKKIPHVKIGRSVLFDPAALAEWIKAGGTVETDRMECEDDDEDDDPGNSSPKTSRPSARYQARARESRKCQPGGLR